VKISILNSQFTPVHRSLVPQIAVWARAYHSDRLRFVAVFGDSVEKSLRTSIEGAEVVFAADSAVEDSYGVNETPTAIAIDESGLVAAPPAVGPADIETRLTQFTSLAQSRTAIN